MLASEFPEFPIHIYEHLFTAMLLNYRTEFTSFLVHMMAMMQAAILSGKHFAAEEVGQGHV